MSNQLQFYLLGRLRIISKKPPRIISCSNLWLKRRKFLLLYFVKCFVWIITIKNNQLILAIIIANIFFLYFDRVFEKGFLQVVDSYKLHWGLCIFKWRKREWMSNFYNHKQAFKKAFIALVCRHIYFLWGQTYLMYVNHWHYFVYLLCSGSLSSVNMKIYRNNNNFVKNVGSRLRQVSCSILWSAPGNETWSDSLDLGAILMILLL